MDEIDIQQELENQKILEQPDLKKDYYQTKKGYPINRLLKANLDLYKRSLPKDWDALFIIDGKERVGKSALAFQLATYCDSSFNIDRIAFTPIEFMQMIKDSEKYQAIVYDESRRGLSARRSMSGINQIIVSMLAEIGQKNLFVFILLPTVFDLDKNVACWRSRALIHVKAIVKMNDDNENEIERGYYDVYGEDKLTDLYVTGKKFYSYKTPQPHFSGRFSGTYVIDEEQYRAKKHESLEKFGKESIRSRQAMEARKLLYLRLLPYLEEKGINLRVMEYAELFEVDSNTLLNWQKELIL